MSGHLSGQADTVRTVRTLSVSVPCATRTYERTRTPDRTPVLSAEMSYHQQSYVNGQNPTAYGGVRARGRTHARARPVPLGNIPLQATTTRRVGPGRASCEGARGDVCPRPTPASNSGHYGP